MLERIHTSTKIIASGETVSSRENAGIFLVNLRTMIAY